MPAKSKYFSNRVGRYIKYTIFATNIIAIILLLACMLAWVVRPSTATVFAYLGLGFPFILAANIAYLILWIVFFRWKYILVQLAVLAICWSPISIYYPMHSETENVPDSCIKILSYNVRAFNWETGKKALENPIFEYIKEQDADIVCIQEYAVGREEGRNKIITQKQVNKILEDYPFHSVIRLGDLSRSRTYGIACFSKYPILKTTEIPLESPYNGSVLYRIKIKDKIVTLVNNHLESNRITAEDKKLYKDFFYSKDKESFDEVTQNIRARLGVAYKTREEQADMISEFLQRENTDATIICGDFNDTPISYVYKKVKGDLVDSFAKTGMGPGITYHENKFWFRIDFIMHSQNMESFNCTVGKVKYSDHYPIMSYLRFK